MQKNYNGQVIKEDDLLVIAKKKPWGFMEIFCENKKSTVKVLTVCRGDSLSYQVHSMRDQLYYMIDDGFQVEYTEPVEDDLFYKIFYDEIPSEQLETIVLKKTKKVFLKKGDMMFFKKGAFHRATYIGNGNSGRYIDIAFGKNREDDIVRLYDKYGRGLINM